jgi:hypothetical protein
LPEAVGATSVKGLRLDAGLEAGALSALEYDSTLLAAEEDEVDVFAAELVSTLEAADDGRGEISLLTVTAGDDVSAVAEDKVGVDAG